jgi:hypothetical protein
MAPSSPATCADRYRQVALGVHARGHLEQDREAAGGVVGLPQHQAAGAVDGALVGAVEAGLLEAVVGQQAGGARARAQAGDEVVAVAQVVERVVVRRPRGVAAVDVQRAQRAVGTVVEQHAQGARHAQAPVGKGGMVEAGGPVAPEQGEYHRRRTGGGGGGVGGRRLPVAPRHCILSQPA